MIKLHYIHVSADEMIYAYDRDVCIAAGREVARKSGAAYDCGFLEGTLATRENNTWGFRSTAFRPIDGPAVDLVDVEWVETGLCSDGTPEGEARAHLAMDLAGD